MSGGSRKASRNLAAAAAIGIAFVGGWFVAEGTYIKAKAIVAQVLLDRAFLSPPEDAARPWAWADMVVAARISAPRIGASDIVLDQTSGEALAFGPGLLKGTAKPGAFGTGVYSGHRDTHFSWIGHLRPKDRIVVETRSGDRFVYEVRRAWVAPFDQPGIETNLLEKRIALTTCWPLDGKGETDLRYIVEAVAVDSPDGLQDIPLT